MIRQEVLEGNWNEIKGKLRQHWGQLTEDDLPQTQGNIEQLVGAIQKKTGEGREAIEKYLEEAAENAGPVIARGAETARRFAQQAVESVGQTTKQATDQMRAGYIQAERFVRHRPTESLAACFGLGLITGVVLGLALRSRAS
jgi:uncharacterized protein YjbJ (UPF0337 family)